MAGSSGQTVSDRTRSSGPMGFCLVAMGFGHQSLGPGCKISSAQPVGTGSSLKSL